LRLAIPHSPEISAQRSFLARWNPVARQYGQRTLALGQI
jgi:hypothetical protein